MAKSLFGGMTDYSHQSLTDIVSDLKHEQENVTGFIDQIETNLDIVKVSGFWPSKVLHNFIDIVAFSLKHYKTAQQELADISRDIQIEVKEHHCK